MKNKSQNVPVDLKTIIAEEEEYKIEKQKIIVKYSHDLESKKSQILNILQTAKDKLKILETIGNASEISDTIEPNVKKDIQELILAKYTKNKAKAESYLNERFYS